MVYDESKSNKTQSARDPIHMSIIKTESNHKITRIPHIQTFQQRQA